MPIKVLMPQFGESVVEGTITKWLKAPGEAIHEFEPLVEVNTDKVDTEVPSPATGILLAIQVQEGATVEAGTILAVIGEAGESISLVEPVEGAIIQKPGETLVKPATIKAPELPAADISSPDLNRDLGFISPVVARMAREHQLDLRLVQGSGQKGRITKSDVEAYLEQRSASPHAPSAQPPAPGRGDQLIPLTPVRRAIAEHMVNSVRTSPHVTTVMEVDLSRVAAHRQANKEAFQRDGANLTYTAYFAAASIKALLKHPIVNSSWSEAGILIHQQVNLGMAASLGEAGLIVPVIKNAETLSLLDLTRNINDMATRARARQLTPDEVQGGTFTITNHGTTGSLFAAPIINQPQCAILGVGMIQKRPTVITDPLGNDALAIRLMAYLSLTFDHRILDGAIADGFLGTVVELLQNWQ